MKVLILTQFYAPEPAFKIPDLARALVDRGHEVQVLTGFPCYPFGRTYEGYRQSWPREEVIDGVRVLRVPQFADHSRSAWRRALYYLTFALSAAVFGVFRVQKADVLLVYQSAMPTGLAALWIAAWRRLPVVLDVVDLWPESVTASGILTGRGVAWLIERAIRFVYRGADRINVITRGYWRNLVEKGVPEKKLSLIHCWPARGLFDPVAPDPVLEEELGLAGRFVVTYAGAMGPLQDLRVVLDAAERLAGENDVRFCLAGEGVQSQDLKEEARRRGLHNVLFPGRLAPEVTRRLYASSGALLVHLRPDPVADLSIPSKTFAYMASGRPLLMAVAGESSELVRRHGCGLTATAGDPADLARAVLELKNLSARDKRALGERARSTYLANYCSEVQIPKYEALLSETAGIRQTVAPTKAAA